MRFITGGRLDFWTLENPIAGRGHRYHRVVIDEAAFAKDGDNKTDGSMMELWEKAIKPTLYDYCGQAFVCSNSAGKKADNFFYNICTDPQYGFHGTTPPHWTTRRFRSACQVKPRRHGWIADDRPSPT
jgi:hypothetical protein